MIGEEREFSVYFVDSKKLEDFLAQAAKTKSCYCVCTSGLPSLSNEVLIISFYS
jgi:hypothetical protein